MSFQINLSDQSKASARFIRRVHREIQKAFSSRSKAGLSQQDLAAKLGINRATINKRLLGQDNLTLRSIADLAWAMDSDIDFKIIPRMPQRNTNSYRAEVTSSRPKRSANASSTPTSEVTNFVVKVADIHAQ